MLLAFVLFASRQAIQLDVSPDGPLRSPLDALHTVQQLRQGDSRRPAEIRIHAGFYALPAPLKLGASDGNLRITGVGPGLPRLSGAEQLTAWHSVTGTADASRFSTLAQTHVRACDLTEDQAAALDEYVPRGFGLPEHAPGLELLESGLPMNLARYPKADSWIRISAVEVKSKFSISDPVPFTWGQKGDLWTLGYWQYDWAEAYEPVRSLDAASKSVILANPKFGYSPQAGRRFAFLNVLAALDGPGQWAYDRSERRVFAWFKNETEPDVSASMVGDPLIQVGGASDVVLAGLDVEGGRNGGIAIQGSTRVQVLDCVVRGMGQYGVSVTSSTGCRVQGCDLTALGSGGMILSGGDRANLVPGNLIAADNHIWNFGRWERTYHPGIYLEGVGNLVTHNHIHTAPHQAIMLSGNDHVIEYNAIEDVCQETGDAGAIYMGRDPTMRGNTIRYNRLSGLSPKVNTNGAYTGVMGVYLDDMFSGTTIFGNIFDMRGTGIMVGGGRDNTVENNVFLNCHPAIHFDARGKGWAAQYINDPQGWDFPGKIRRMKVDQPPYSTIYPSLAQGVSDITTPAGNRFLRNIDFGGTWMDLLDHLTAKDFDGQGNVVNTGNASLTRALAAAPAGFTKIPVDEIGLRHHPRPSDQLTSPG